MCAFGGPLWVVLHHSACFAKQSCEASGHLTQGQAPSLQLAHISLHGSTKTRYPQHGPSCPARPRGALLPQDFFFRTVHLGTECWAFVALNRIASAYEMAQQGRWHVAAARAGQVGSPQHARTAAPVAGTPAQSRQNCGGHCCLSTRSST